MRGIRRGALLLGAGVLTACAAPADGGAAPALPDRAGTASRALECDGRPIEGGGGIYDTGLPVQDTAADALDHFLTEESFLQVPSSGYRAEREDEDRVLFSFDVRGRTRVAFVVADGTLDVEGDEGWGVVSWARCDVSELPDEVTEALGIGVWTDPSGARVPVSAVQSRQGSEHCGWEDITFLSVGTGRTGDRYLRDTHGELQSYLTTTFSAAAHLPPEAMDTGYGRDGRRLWLAADRSAAYLVSTADGDDGERWPAMPEPVGCR